MSLKCAVQLGIPEAVNSNGGRPITLPDLVTALKIPPTKAPNLRRLIRVLDKPINGGTFVVMVLDPVLVRTYHDMSTWFLSEKEDPTPFHAANGKHVWEYMGDEPKMNDVFNEAMATDSCLVGELVVKEGKSVFEGVGSLVDVAGGTGTMAKAIATSFPEIDCTVMDLPHVVSGLEGSRNLKFVAGDMFESIPAADAVLLKVTL
ncbi:Trans-resveratrol di-O-methyltransferase [Linum perenne]